MFKVSKVFLPLVGLLFLVGCSSSDDTQAVVEDILDKNSVLLSNLSAHEVTYVNPTNSALNHTDVYCSNDELRDTANTATGTWAVSVNNELTVDNTTAGTNYIFTTSGTLEKDKSYATSTGDSFTVTKIAVEVNCLVPAK
ncbi:MAG: hypothetical protein DRQ44_10965 [Gammaproteobacteria bacterium]|nr:MAG: hypothetical protein DRQ44_10965 [Gammaproteobacteria bacterium]